MPAKSPNIKCSFSPSAHFAQALIFIHMLASACILSMPVAASHKLITLALIACCLIRALQCWNLNNDVTHIAVIEDFFELTQKKSAHKIQCYLQHSHLVTQHCLLLRFSCDNSTPITLLIFSDSTHPDDFRQLRAWTLNHTFKKPNT
jgi:hypothetical protein